MMKCNNAGTIQICWGDWGGGKFDEISFSHCSEKAREREHTTAEEYINAPDLYEFLNTFNCRNPEGHNFSVCRFNRGVDTVCDFSSNEKLIKVDNSLSIGCNCRCKFCFKMQGNNAISPDQKPEEAFAMNDFIKKTYIDTFYRLKGKHLKMLRATDNGEPLLYKKELLEFLSECTTDDFEIFGITTNGELLDKEFIDKLKECSEKGGFKVVFQVSLNAFTADTRRTVMHSKRDIEEIKEAAAYARETTKFLMNASIVVVEENLPELGDLDDWCKEHQINFIVSAAYGTKYYPIGAPYIGFHHYDNNFEAF